MMYRVFYLVNLRRFGVRRNKRKWDMHAPGIANFSPNDLYCYLSIYEDIVLFIVALWHVTHNLGVKLNC